MRAALEWTGIVPLSLIAVAALALTVFTKQLVEYGLTQALGREVQIKGELDIDLSSSPTIHAENLRIANAEWSEIPNMLEVGALTTTIYLSALLDGRIVIPELRLIECTSRDRRTTDSSRRGSRHRVEPGPSRKTA